MIVLALDTCHSACSAAIVEDGRVIASGTEAMARGHQERLAPLIEGLMGEANLDFAALDLIAVTVGPGSFTGLRIGLAFAKGLALALDRPCAGVGSLEALAASAGANGFRAAIIDAGRGAVYVQVFDESRALTEPASLPIATAGGLINALVGESVCQLVGPGAALLVDIVPAARSADLQAPRPEVVATIAASRPVAAPRPLYLRPADAKPKAR